MLVRSFDVIVVSSDDEEIQDSLDRELQAARSDVPRQLEVRHEESNRWWELLSQFDNEGNNLTQTTPLVESRGTKRAAEVDVSMLDEGSEPLANVPKRLPGLNGLAIGNSGEKERETNISDRKTTPTVDSDSVVVILSSDDEQPELDSVPVPEKDHSPVERPQIAENSYFEEKEPQLKAEALEVASDDLDSDDEIAVLSKEEAEKTGKFKPSTFISRHRPQVPLHRARGDPRGGADYRHLLANHQFNSPVPLLQPLGDPHQMEQDRRAEHYFATQTIEQLRAYESTLDAQLARFDGLRDSYLSQMKQAKERLETLPINLMEERSDLIREIDSTLSDANVAIQRAKKIRRYKAVLHHVLVLKHSGGYMAPPGYPQQNFFNYNMPGYTGPHTQTSMTGFGGMTQNVYEDSVHLQELLKDVGNEEKVEGMAMTPSELNVSLLDHQRRGLFWLLNREKEEQGSILADDMGLGKTVQTIALIMANPSEDKNCKTTLIVGPVSLLRQWSAEFRAKVKMEYKPRVVFYHGADKKKVNTFIKMRRYDVVLTSYTTLASEYKLHYAKPIEEAMVSHGQNILPDRDLGGQTYESPFFTSNAQFYRVVLDEAQYIKNKVSQTSKATALLKSKHRLCLTGTPMQNNVDELYPILRFLKTRPYNDETKFKRDISVNMRSNNDEADEYDRNVSMKKLRAILLAIMLRRTKDSKVDGKPLIELPKKTVKNVSIRMDEEEAKAYKNLEAGIQKKAEKLLKKKHKNSHSNILTLLLRLRQACIHDILVEVGEMNAEENREGYGGVKNWKTMYALCLAISPEMKRRIAEDLLKNEKDLPVDVDDDDSDAQLTCPMCFDVVDLSSIVILHPCGHMICDGCVDSLFEQEGNEDGLVPCNTCRQSITEDALISYVVYNQVVNENLSFEELRAQYGTGMANKTTTAEKINKITHERGGFTLSAKMQRALDLIENVTKANTDEKVIVFSHFTGTFDLMAKALKDAGIRFLRYDGSMNIDLKNSTIRRFYLGTERVLLISLKAGNVGLTLTCANHVVIMDPFWNPFVEDQAMDRAHRFGQQKPVHVYKLLVTDSVEDRIINLQDRKKELVNSALDSTALKKSSALGRQELGYLFGLNAMT